MTFCFVAARALQNNIHNTSHLFRTRVANACDICKLRKIKCSGTKPCAYCVKKGLPVEACHYTAQKERTGRVRRKIGSDDTDRTGVNVVGVGNGNERVNVSSTSLSPGILCSGTQQQSQPQQSLRSGPPSQHSLQTQGVQHNHQNQQLPNPSKKRKRRRSFRTITTTPREDADDSSHGHVSHDEDEDGDEDDNSAADNEPDDTEVPRDARLVRDPQGKLIFIGDCAPLSFFQTVRRLVTSRVDANAFSDGHGPSTGSENHSGGGTVAATTATTGIRTGIFGSGSGPPEIDISTITAAVEAYFQITAGLVDLFEEEEDEDDDHHVDSHGYAPKLEESITTWANSVANGTVPADAASAVNYLVLAIGHQALVHPPSSLQPPQDRDLSQSYFNYARTLAFADLTGNFGIGSLQGVQVHILIAVYMLLAHHTHTNGANGAFLFFGIAARAAYSIGIHRTEINARFGEKIKKQRERIWRSIRVVDLFLSTSMGRPPAASDVDCTVGYSTLGEDEKLDLLNASVQILLITERVVLQVYSRRKISVQLTEGISRELRAWSLRWLGRLQRAVEGNSKKQGRNMVNGACQVLASYYYAVILVSRPFLMVELHHRLGSSSSTSGGDNGNGNGLVSGRTKLADACIDAAVLMVTPVQDLISRGEMARRAPVVVSWLFAASLVLGLGLLGGFGRVIEKHCRASIAALEYFAESDAHAAQYSMIARSLLGTAMEYLERRETEERKRRTENSAKIFGLIPRGNTEKHGQGEGLEPAATTTYMTGAGTGNTPGVENHNVIFGDAGLGPEKGHDNQQQPGSLEHEVLSPPRMGTNANTNSNYGFASSFFGLGGGESSLPKTPEFSSLMGISMDDSDETFGALNLFPLLDSDGIDLANLF
ncbi:hypothetical protein V8F20_008996 [Naviculisporaceae sp. PSN 640]